MSALTWLLHLSDFALLTDLYLDQGVSVYGQAWPIYEECALLLVSCKFLWWRANFLQYLDVIVWFPSQLLGNLNWTFGNHLWNKKRYIFRSAKLIWVTRQLISVVTTWWSLFPKASPTSHFVTAEGSPTNTRSNVLGPLVGESTICTSKLSWMVSKKLLLSSRGALTQLMFLKLKSPIKIAFCVYILSMAQQILSRIWPWSTSEW